VFCSDLRGRPISGCVWVASRCRALPHSAAGLHRRFLNIDSFVQELAHTLQANRNQRHSGVEVAALAGSGQADLVSFSPNLSYPARMAGDLLMAWVIPAMSTDSPTCSPRRLPRSF